jgi:hypothetical protein
MNTATNFDGEIHDVSELHAQVAYSFKNYGFGGTIFQVWINIPRDAKAYDAIMERDVQSAQSLFRRALMSHKTLFRPNAEAYRVT